MGETYAKGLILDRKDNDRGYSKANCRWATPRESLMNRSNTLVVDIQAISASSGVLENTIYYRLRRGWDVADLGLLRQPKGKPTNPRGTRLPNQRKSI